MKIHIVTVTSGWILQKIANNIFCELRMLHQCTIGSAPDLSADVNFYVDISNCYFRKTPGLDVGIFTHLHEDDVRNIRQEFFSLDFIFHQTERYLNMFKPFFPQEKMAVIPFGETYGKFNIKKPCLGIFQRGGFVGKGNEFMLKLGENGISKRFKYLFVGSGWDDVVDLYSNNGISVEYVSNEGYEQYDSLYDKIDYLLVPSLWEGGPMSILEGLSKGIPIISSHVGWVGNHFIVDFMYTPNNIEQLVDILKKVLYPIDSRVNQIKNLSYHSYSKKISSVFEVLYDKT